MDLKANKTVVIHLGNGNLVQGLPQIAVRLWADQALHAEQIVGSLPASPELAEIVRIWQSTYQALCSRQVLRQPPTDIEDAVVDELEVDAEGVTQVSQQSFETCSQQLQQILNGWLKSNGFLKIEQRLRSQLHPADDIRIIFETSDHSLQRLPWHCWTFFQDYPSAEMVLSRLEYRRHTAIHPPKQRRAVRILAILGDRRGIDVAAEQEMLQNLADAEMTFLVAPSRREFNEALWDSTGWDLLFFAGHSQTEGASGRLYINELATNNSVTVEQLEESLHTAVERGLKLAIFNSCDGMGLARALETVQIPQVIVMREPVPNQVAQQFLKYFLDAFAVNGLSLHRAMRQARRRLQGLEDDFPGASWLPVLCQNPAVKPSTWIQMGGMSPCPYRGLFAFQEADAPLFFGREQVTDALTAAVQANRKPFVVVVGPSGSGKSSVVFAGLVPRLRPSVRSPGWQIVSCRPGNQPFDTLAEALLELEVGHQRGISDPLPVATSSDRPFRLQVLELSVHLQQTPQSLCQWLQRWHQDYPTMPLLLIVDQFEELYTLCAEADRQPFLDQLLDAVQFAPAFTLLLTLRADFYGYALSDRRFSDRLQSAVYNLGPMSREELQRAIVQPAACMEVQLEAGLTDKLLQATWAHAGRLPLLEFTLTELWSQQQDGWLTHAAYEALGGVEEALANHAERVYGQLHPIDQQRMQRIFMQLVEPGFGADLTRRLATPDEVGESNWDLVTFLASERLVVTNRNEVTQEETVEVIHEALIQNWARLELWLQLDGEFRRWQEQLRRSRWQWEEGDRETDLLLRGKRLVVAKDWYDSRREELSSRDAAFIECSLESQERERRQRQRRRQWVISSLLSGLLVALLLAGTAWWGWQNAAISEVNALSTSSTALFASDQRLDALVAALKAWQKRQTLAWKDPDTWIRSEESLRQATYSAIEQNRFSGNGGQVYSVAFSPDGQLVASAHQDQTVKLWKPDGTLLKVLKGHTERVFGVTFSPDGQVIASGGGDQTIRLWSQDGTLLNTLKGHVGSVNKVRFSPDGQTIASASSDKTIRLWHRDGKLLGVLKGHKGEVLGIAFSPRNQTIASASDDRTVKLWKLDGTLLKTFEGHRGGVQGVAFSPDGEMLASASLDATVRLWKLDDTRQNILSSNNNQFYAIAFSPDGQTIAAATWGRTVEIWNREGRLLTSLKGHNAFLFDVTFSADGQTIASASGDETVRLWKFDRTLLTPLYGHRSEVNDVAFSSDGQTIATAGADDTVKLWSHEGLLLNTLKGHTDQVRRVSFSPRGNIIASTSLDGTIRLWDRNGLLINILKGHTDGVEGISFDPTQEGLIASASYDDTVRLWDRHGKQVDIFKGNGQGFNNVTFSANGQTIAASNYDGTVKLWKRNGQLRTTLKSQNSTILGIAFSPDNQLIATVGGDKTLRLWSQDGVLSTTAEGHKARIWSVKFSPDSKMVATGSADSTIKLWKRNGQQLATLYRHSADVNAIDFSPSGQILASAGQDGVTILWNLESDLALEKIAVYACSWVQNYLNTNAELQQKDRSLCSKL